MPSTSNKPLSTFFTITDRNSLACGFESYDLVKVGYRYKDTLYSGGQEIKIGDDHRYYNTIKNIVSVSNVAGSQFVLTENLK